MNINNGNIQFVGVPGVGKSLILENTLSLLKEQCFVEKFEFGKELSSILKLNGTVLNDGEIPKRDFIDFVIKKCLLLSQEKLVLMTGHIVHYDYKRASYKIETKIDKILTPKAYFYIYSDPEQIYLRRILDTTRAREVGSKDIINQHQIITKRNVKRLASKLNSNYFEVINNDGNITNVVDEIVLKLKNI